MPKSSEARVRATERREAILRAAERLFADKGFAPCRLEDVAQEVGIRRASIVYYFRGKHELYDAVLDSVFGDLLDRYRMTFERPGPIGDRVLDTISAFVTYVGERPSVVRLFLRALVEPTVHPTISRHVLPLVTEVMKYLRQGEEEGVFAAVDHVHFVNAIAGTTILLVTAGPMSWPGWDGPLDGETLERHRIELLGMAKRLLGLPTTMAEEDRRTARVGGSK